MNPIRAISLTSMKAAVITSVVVLGFGIASALGLPAWLQGFFLIPAMLLFYRLYGERDRASWNILGWKLFVFNGLLSAFLLLVTWGAKHLPGQHLWYYALLILLIVPFDPMLNWFERRFFPKQHKSEQPGTGQPATRPVDKPEGSDKPQPEAEGRSQ